MHRDLHDCEVPDLQAEVCIIGAGAAGITLARRLLQSGHQVVLLESGGLDYEAESSALNHGECIGHPYYELEHSRLRFFGGTSAIWGGRVAELDPVDFERRKWIAHSGWPFGYETLRPYYADVWKSFFLASGRDGLAAVRDRLGIPDFGGNLETRIWRFDPRFDRFDFDACEDLRVHPRCTVLTHATATEIVTNGESLVTEIIVRSHQGQTARIQARAFVLAAGGIENPRLLLASNRQAAGGIGNRHDLVGRFFMEHPHARGGRIVGGRRWLLLNAFGRSHVVAGQRLAALLTAAPARQHELGILNSSLTVAPRQPTGASQFIGMRAYNKIKHDLPPTRLGRALWKYSKRVATSAQMVVDPLRPWLLDRAGRLELALFIRAEQAPNPDSRIRLTGDRDALGMQRISLDWRLSEIDKHSVSQLVTLAAQEFSRLSLGRVEHAPWLADPDQAWRTDNLISAHPIGGYHHMGTTRMADHERQGVTDQFGGVFGIHNLYVAGSSLFPTSGWANPTLTLLALALRTADQISLQLRQPAASTAGTARARAYG
jgi:choline dehydrogenase-like flavoprotein